MRYTDGNYRELETSGAKQKVKGGSVAAIGFSAGGQLLQRYALGGVQPAMVYYTNGFTSDTVHQKSYKMVKANGGLEPHPSVARAFYADLWGHAAREYASARSWLKQETSLRL